MIHPSTRTESCSPAAHFSVNVSADSFSFYHILSFHSSTRLVPKPLIFSRSTRAFGLTGPVAAAVQHTAIETAIEAIKAFLRSSIEKAQAILLHLALSLRTCYIVVIRISRKPDKEKPADSLPVLTGMSTARRKRRAPYVIHIIRTCLYRSSCITA